MSVPCEFPIWWKGFNEQVIQTETLKELIALVTREGNVMGFPYCSFIIKHAIPFTHPDIDFLGNYPAEWVSRYKSEKYSQTDPIFLAAESTQYTIEWQHHLKRENEKLFREAKKFGIVDGFSQSSLGNDGTLRILSFCRRKPLKHGNIDMVKLKINCISVLINARINELKSYSSYTNPPSLSLKEKEILKWTADGKIAEEIGAILNVSESTVNFHICNILKKFNAPNKTLAAAYSAACRLLTR